MNRMMKQHYVSPIRLAPAACGLVMLLGLTTAGIAQQAPATVAPVAVAAESPNPAKPASEGIKVHGLWVIDVKNPDGTLAEHRVFENSLQDSNTLVGLLGGYYVAGDFGIRLGYQTSPSICPTSSCYIVQSTTTQLGTDVCGAGNCQLGLTKTVNLYNGVGAPTAPSLVLAGQYTALQTGTVGQVGTNIGRCGSAAGPASTTTPSACPSIPSGSPLVSDYLFTGTYITPIPVSSGQIVQVSVTITFS